MTTESKRKYIAPELVRYGSLRVLTLEMTTMPNVNDNPGGGGQNKTEGNNLFGGPPNNGR